VRLRLTPRDEQFAQLFMAAADNLVVAADLLAQFVAADADRDALCRSLREREHAGDDITHRVLRQLNSTFVTPFDREDIHELAGRLDDVLDSIDAAADFVVLSRLTELPPEAAAQAELLQQAARATAGMMSRLPSMRDLEPYWIEVNRLENEADDVYRRLLSRLFAGETDAVTVLKVKQVADELENAADGFEHVAHVVQTIAVKES
jgi:predicted phosphate transport protein (TIGR00153 family)